MLLLTTIKNTMKMFREHRQTYLGSLLVFQLIRTVIIVPLISWLFLTALRFGGLSSLTEKNVLVLLRQPFSIIFLILLGLLTILFIYYEQAYYLLLQDTQRHNQPVRFRQLFQKLNKKVGFFLSFQSLFFVLYFVLVLPIASLGMSASLTKSLRIPHFISDEWMKSQSGMLLYVLLLVVIFYLSLRFLFVVPFFVLESELTIGQAFKRSWQFTKKKQLRILLTLGVVAGLYALVVLIGTGILFLPLLVIEPFFPMIAPFIAGVTLTVIQLFLFISFGLLQVLLATVLLYLIHPDQQLFIEKTVKKQSLKRVYLWIGSVLLLVMAGINSYAVSETLYQPKTQVVAHRGYVANQIDNTIAALEDAAKAGADLVEMDIQETKDHQFAVFHDGTLSRLANRKEAIRELTLAQLQAIPLKDGHKIDKIASLEEYIEAAKKHNIRLLIELKPYGTPSPDMIERFVKIMEEYNVVDTFLVQTNNEQFVREIHERNPKIKVGLVIALNIGDLPDTEADFIALEEFSINRRLVEKAHEQGYPLFVWTVNQEDLTRQVLGLNVDGIITDHVTQAIQVRDSFDEQQTFFERVQSLLN